LPRVEVRLYTVLSEAAGKRKVQIEASSVEEAISTLIKMFGEKFKENLIDEKTGSIKSFYNVLVNGKRLFLPREMALKLKEKDVVDIFPPVGGGT